MSRPPHLRRCLPLLALGWTVLTVALAGCRKPEDKPPAEAASPTEVVRAAYLAANEGRYSDAEKHLSAEVIAAKQAGLWALGGRAERLLGQADPGWNN